MWKWLHPYAKSETQYHLCGKLAPFFAILTILSALCMCMCRRQFGRWGFMYQWQLPV